MVSQKVLSRRGFLATIGSLTGTRVGRARDSTRATCHGGSAKQYWQTITTNNWGYTKTGLKTYHNKTGNYGAGRKVLVIDNGFATDHPLYNRVQKSGDKTPYHVNIHGVHLAGHEKIDDQAAHGTGVTGILWQAAPKADFYLAKKERAKQGSIESQARALNDVISGLEYAKHAETRFDVVNISAGGPQLLEIISGLPVTDIFLDDPRDAIDKKHRRLRTLTNDLAAAGTLVTAGAGNEADNSILPLVPSAAQGALSVASSTSTDRVSPGGSPQFSWWGKPDVVAPGTDVLTLGRKTDKDSHVGVCGSIERSGSSFASPFVAGIGLLLLNHGTTSEVKAALRSSAIELGEPEFNIPGNDRDGHGRVSITKAYDILTAKHRQEIASAENSWPMFHVDPANTGAKGETTGPTPEGQNNWPVSISITQGTDNVINSPVVVNGTVYVGDHSGVIHALDAKTGDSVWNYRTEKSRHEPMVQSTPTVVDGTVFVGYDVSRWDSEYLLALDAKTGKPVWDSPVKTNAGRSNPTVVDGTVYVGGGGVNAIDTKTGTANQHGLWPVSIGIGRGSPAVVDDTVYAVGSNSIYALDAQTGAFRNGEWPVSIGSSDSSPAVANDTVYVGGGKKVYALDVKTGRPVWNKPFQTNGNVRSNPAVANGVIYVGSTDGNIYALNAETGKLAWNEPFEIGGSVLSSPAVANGAVYVGDDRGNVYAINAQTGSSLGGLWPVGTNGLDVGIAGSPAVIDDTVYVRSFGLVAIDAQTGQTY